MSNFPGSLDNGTSLPDPNPTDSTLGAHSALHTNENAAIRALETKLGTGATTPTTQGQVLRYNGANTIWQQLTYGDLVSSPPLSGTNTGDQTLAISGTTLSISGVNGNSVTLPAGGGGGGTWGSITGTLSAQTDLQTALSAKQGSLTLTTTGTSGAATLTGSTLNIPQYTGGGSGTVTSASVVTANGFAGTVATPSTTPAITITTSITGIIKGNGTALSAASAGSDYTTPSSTETVTNKNLTSGTNTFPTFNQNTTGTASNITGTLAVLQGGTGATTTTGAGANVLAGSPVLTGTPTIAAAVATSLNVSGQITSTQATGTSPFTITSTTVNTNLNADLVDGIHANTTATANQLLALDGSGKFPTSVLPTTTWTAVTYTNSWVDFGGAFNTGAYRKDAMGYVHLKGLMKSGTISSSLPAFNLPAGFRPLATVHQITDSNDAVGVYEITAAGNFLPVIGSNVFVSLEGITFYAEN